MNPLSLTDSRVPGAVLRLARELDNLPLGAVIRARSSEAPVYFRRSLTGWQACDIHGDTRLQLELVLELEGWPHALMADEILRPATVVSVPVEMAHAPRTQRMARL